MAGGISPQGVHGGSVRDVERVGRGEPQTDLPNI